MTRGFWWAAAAAAAAGVLGSAAGCGEAREPGGDAANVTAGCASCHTGPGEGPPFRDADGATAPTIATVAAHDAHLHGGVDRTPIGPPIACAECHTVPRTVTDPGHFEDSPDDIRFGPLATARGATPAYDPQARTCATAYCHGSFPGGNAANRPAWTGGAAAAQCGSCHGLPPQTGAHPDHAGRTFQGRSILCSTCHGDLVPATHVNGSMEVPLPVWSAANRSCAQACHGPERWDED